MLTRPRKSPQPPRMEESPYSMPVSWELFWYHKVGELEFPAAADGLTLAKMWLCPFHADKKPGSFYVSILDGHYHCFSCGAHGSAQNYVHEVDGLSWPEAYRYVKEHG